MNWNCKGKKKKKEEKKKFILGNLKINRNWHFFLGQRA